MAESDLVLFYEFFAVISLCLWNIFISQNKGFCSGSPFKETAEPQCGNRSSVARLHLYPLTQSTCSLILVGVLTADLLSEVSYENVHT